MLQKRSDIYFQYPANIKTLDLATMVQLFRTRGTPFEVPQSEVVACAFTRRLIKVSKTWFGLHYSQRGWDALQTTGSQGYPMTDVELNVLGLFLNPPFEDVDRSFVENNCSVLPQLVYLIINDLLHFGFLEDHEGTITVTGNGIKALDGIARRIYEKKFFPEMLQYYQEHGLKPDGRRDTTQTQLF